MLKKGLIDVKWGLRRIVCCLEEEHNPLPHQHGGLLGGGGQIILYIFSFGPGYICQSRDILDR